MRTLGKFLEKYTQDNDEQPILKSLIDAVYSLEDRIEKLEKINRSKENANNN